ncbi:uncharacterized protein LOC128878162 isoform X2 [Hylaeus volcanicus]|uniref:uncharacterized protein LOC128878162 isoform X2 n=1 Tax=Hylaeus volcanicus TaxID=313075 RepID=UPI0023B7AA3F|nr:uncharacterized protein LOC128878162 isoform X2 [Hylaeus volcanicus]
MPNTKDPFDEDVSLLYPDSRGGKFHMFPHTHYETPIIKGVVCQLRKWPMDLFFAFMTACLVIGTLLFLVFVTVVVALPTIIDNRVKDISTTKINASSNVYFFKLENQNWSTMEFCYIETAARRHPDLNVYLINLLREEPVKRNSNEWIANRARLKLKLNDSVESSYFPKSTPEEQLRKRLASGETNIRNVNISIDKFFKGTKLSHAVKGLNDEILEMAAKAQLLWTVPGIALKPNMFCALDSMKQFICKDKDLCQPDTLATIELENDIQLTGVPCQAFMGFLVREISKRDFTGTYTLTEAVRKYCPRMDDCPEIRIVNLKTKCQREFLECPIVYSSAIRQEDANPGNIMT